MVGKVVRIYPEIHFFARIFKFIGEFIYIRRKYPFAPEIVFYLNCYVVFLFFFIRTARKTKPNAKYEYTT